MADSIITTGDSIRLPVTLRRNGQTFPISSSAEIKAAFADARFSVLISPVVSVANVPGSDWENSLIIVALDPPESDSIQAGKAGLEVEVLDGGIKTTWQIPGIVIKKGLI